MPTLESNGNTILESNATDGAAIYTTYNGIRVQIQYSFYAQSKGSDTPEERERIGNPTGWIPIAAETQQGRTIVIYKFSYDTDLFRPSDPYAYADLYQAIAYSPETGDLIGAYGKNNTFYESSNLPLLDPNFSLFWGEDEDYFLERFRSIINPRLGNSNQQADGFTQLSDADESLTGQSDIKIRMLGGNDYLEVTGGNNYANGNMGEDTIILRGGFGQYLGGKDSDTIEVFAAEAGTSVNGNLGSDFITGTVAGVNYRGGKDNDLLAVSQGDVWGDKNADTFRAVSGDGFAVIQDYTIGEDMVEIEMDGSWSNVGDGLMFTDDSGDQLMLLLGISDVEQVTMV